MAEYQLYCFAQSGNAYRAALMLNLIGADWKPTWVDFFVERRDAHAGISDQRQRDGRSAGAGARGKKLSQSGVILNYLAERSGKFAPQGEDERLEALRWIIFDNQKVNGFLGPVPVSQEFRQAGGRSGRHRLSQRPDRRQSRDRQQAARDAGLRARRAADHRGPLARRPTCIIRRRNSASTSPRTIRRSAPGSSA